MYVYACMCYVCVCGLWWQFLNVLWWAEFSFLMSEVGHERFIVCLLCVLISYFQPLEVDSY